MLNNYLLSLIDITGVDLSNLKNYNFFFLPNFNPAITLDKLLIYNLINYKTNLRAIFSLFCGSQVRLYSLDAFFFNSNWVERELIEFFGIKIINKKDTRNLLLDYNLQINPLLKNFPTEGFQELYFNFNSFNLDYINNEFIEL